MSLISIIEFQMKRQLIWLHLFVQDLKGLLKRIPQGMAVSQVGALTVSSLLLFLILVVSKWNNLYNIWIAVILLVHYGTGINEINESSVVMDKWETQTSIHAI